MIEKTCYLNKYTGETLPVTGTELIGSSLFLKGEEVWSSHVAALLNCERLCFPEIDKALGVLYHKGVFPDAIVIENNIIRRAKKLADR